ncbi:MAG: DNA polymerase/3'-5' exonuclease PolX [Candidatus Curtissbacteria bacterium]|nr:DNA polymerase/3'-5' exonuclease PolX [Candidatus Curtissbacteria bacterium]
MKYFSNKEIEQLLRTISAAYAATGGNSFKVIAYENAANSVEHATSELKDLWDDGKLDTVPGLGKSIQAHLDELFRTGKVKHFEELKKSLPKGMFPLLGLVGLGPKNAYKLAKELKIKTIKDLEDAAKAGRIRELPGFGEKSEKDILVSISESKTKTTDRYPLPTAFNQAERILQHLRSLKEVERAEPLGSLRRMVATVGDVDIAVASEKPEQVIEHFKKFREISRILNAGPRKSSALLYNGLRIDLMVQPTKAFGALLQHFTGSKNHNIHLRELAQKKDIKVSDLGIEKGGKLHEFETEEEFYKFLGMDYIEPEIREDTGEIEAAIAKKLPDLVSLKDIKGDIHLHSSYNIEPSHDLGKNSMEEIIKKAKSLKYEYIGLSDHSPGVSTHSKAKIVDLIKKRKDKIEQLKSSNKNIGLLNLLEIDILTNGELSVPVEGLKLLDGSIAGIHSSHSQDKKTITERLLVACRSPYVQLISHPTGRLLLQRESYDVDWPKVFEECQKTGTMLEINAWPSRLDLPDTLVREALSYGIKFIINTDAHAVGQMDNMHFGVSVARRGWATKKDITNTRPWVEFKKLFTPFKK